MSNANIEYRKAKDKRGKPVRGLWNATLILSSS